MPATIELNRLFVPKSQIIYGICQTQDGVECVTEIESAATPADTFPSKEANAQDPKRRGEEVTLQFLSSRALTILQRIVVIFNMCAPVRWGH